MKIRRTFVGAPLAALAVAIPLAVWLPAHGLTVRHGAAAALGIHKIKHVIVITQENRSFDDYFGTYPGATGFRAASVCPTSCAAAASVPMSTILTATLAYTCCTTTPPLPPT